VSKLLLINPNTSVAITALLQSHASLAALPGTRVHSVTARLGAPYIACEASYAIAGHATLDAWAAALSVNAQGADPEAFDAVLIGCFGDPGLMALRECSAAPVTGLAEASFIEAARSGRFAIVTGGARWQPILERLAAQLGFASQLAGIHTVEQSGAELARDPQAPHLILSQACTRAALQWNASAVILGGAGLAGMAAVIQPVVPVPVIDSLQAGVRVALQTPVGAAQPQRKFEFAWTSLSPELSALSAPA